MAAVATIGGSLISGASSIFGAQSAASAQKKAAAASAATQQQFFNAIQRQLSPYMQTGEAATGELRNRLTDLTAPVTMDQATLEQTPGYQFNLTQGLKATQNSAAARGLGSSGAALKGAATYATGLADSTYQNQFNNAWTNKNNAYNILSGTANTGAQAASMNGQFGMNAGNNISNSLIGAGNAQAGADIATGNAIGSSVNNGISSYLLYNKLFGNAGSASSATGGLY
jgi:hypothetical protein